MALLVRLLHYPNRHSAIKCEAFVDLRHNRRSAGEETAMTEQFTSILWLGFGIASAILLLAYACAKLGRK